MAVRSSLFDGLSLAALGRGIGGALTICCALTCALACRERPSPSAEGSSSNGTTAPTASASASASAATAPEEAELAADAPADVDTPDEAHPAQAAPTRVAADESGGPTLDRPLTTRWRLGELHDLSPAGPMVATAEGVYVAARDDRLLLVRRNGETFEAIDEPAENFSRFGRGPALTPRHVYWISPQGKLLRAPRQKSGQGEPLASLARSGTRVSALVASGRDLVAYLGGDDDNPKAFLWAEGGAPLCASEDATSASSVELLAGPTHPRLAILEGRLGMSPVHLRTVRVTKHHVNLAADEIIWIGPGSEPLTELMALGAPNGSASLFLATSRDPSHFGLAHFSLGPDSGQHAEPKWRMYENGLDPAPVHPSRLCRGDFVFYVAPSHRAPRAPQELRVARRLGNGDLVEEEVLARAKAFNDVSATDAPGGAVVAWTADRRTWALFVGCPG